MQEIEVKILEIEVEAVKNKLTAIGAELHFSGEMLAVFFDNENHQLKANGQVLRLRKEGEEIVMAFKSPISKIGSKIMEEYETRVDDMEGMRAILKNLGFNAVKETHKFRDEYVWGDCKIVIDDYQGDLAHIPSFLEIEAPSEERIKETASALGLSHDTFKAWDTRDLVNHYAGLSE